MTTFTAVPSSGCYRGQELTFRLHSDNDVMLSVTWANGSKSITYRNESGGLARTIFHIVLVACCRLLPFFLLFVLSSSFTFKVYTSKESTFLIDPGGVVRPA